MVKQDKTNKIKAKILAAPRLKSRQFIRQLLKMLSNGQNEGIRWRKDGFGFTIHDQDKFFKKTLEMHFPLWKNRIVRFATQASQYFFVKKQDQKPHLSFYHNRPFHKRFRKSQPNYRIESRSYEQKLKNYVRKKARRQQKIRKSESNIKFTYKITKPEIKNVQSKPEIKDINGLKEKIFVFVGAFKKQCKDQKADYLENFIGINNLLRSIEKFKSQQQTSLKRQDALKNVNNCYQIYINVFKNLQNFQKSLKELFQGEVEKKANNNSKQTNLPKQNDKQSISLTQKSFDKEKSPKKDNSTQNVQTEASLSKQKIQPLKINIVSQSPVHQPINKHISPSRVNSESIIPFLRQQQLFPEKKQNKKYLENHFSEEEINGRYRKIQSLSDRYQLSLSRSFDFDVKEFVQYNWDKVRSLGLRGCFMKTQDWKILSQNGKYFKNLRCLILNDNEIQQIRIDEINQFPKLKILRLSNNYLTLSSKKEITNWKDQDIQRQFMV